MGLFSFEPAWKKDDPKSEKKTLDHIAKLDAQPELAQIALEAPAMQSAWQQSKSLQIRMLLRGLSSTTPGRPGRRWKS